MIPKVLYYECKSCGTRIHPDTMKKLCLCKCGKIGVDGSISSSRIIGKIEFLKTVFNEELTYAYRIKDTATGLFFKPSVYRSRSNWSVKGKFYTRKPSLSWVYSNRATCVIEKYLLTTI